MKDLGMFWLFDNCRELGINEFDACLLCCGWLHAERSGFPVKKIIRQINDLSSEAVKNRSVLSIKIVS